MSKKKYCVITAIFNNYEVVREPEVIDDNCDYYLFTDNKNLYSKVYKVYYIPSLDTDKLIGIQKTLYFKWNCYKFIPNLDEYEYVVRIDGSIQIVGSLQPIINYLHKGKYDISIGVHPDRTNMYEEYVAWQAYRKLDAKYTTLFVRFINTYNHLNFKEGLCETTIQIYKNTKKVWNLIDEMFNVLNKNCACADLNDQCYFTTVMSNFKDKLKVNYHNSNLYRYIGSKYFKLCFHGKTAYCQTDEYNTKDIIYDKKVKINNFQQYER